MKRLAFFGALMAIAPGTARSQPPAAAESPAPEAAAPADASASADATKILVIPYQPIFRSVRQKQVDTATKYLAEELGSKDTITVMRAGTAIEGQPEPSMDTVDAARRQAEEAEADHRIQDAIRARQRVIAQMTENASALPDDAAFILAHHYLARVLMWSGQDDAAKSALNAAARMDPNVDLPADQFSRLYRKWFRSQKQELRRDSRGELLVRSVLPGAIISIDGRELDVAPVKVTRILPGKHLITAQIDGLAPSRSVVEVDPKNKNQEVTIGFGKTIGGPSIGAVADAVAENKLPASAIKAAEAAGEDAGAEWVVLGGLAKEVDHFNVHTYLLKVGTGKISPINVTQFDAMLLTAESDVLRVILGIEKQLKTFDGAVASVNQMEAKIRPAKVVNEESGEPDLSTKSRPKQRGPDKKPQRRGPIRPVGGLDDDIKDD